LPLPGPLPARQCTRKAFYDAVVIASDCVSYLKPGSSLVNTRDGLAVILHTSPVRGFLLMKPCSSAQSKNMRRWEVCAERKLREIFLFLTYECAALHSGWRNARLTSQIQRRSAGDILCTRIASTTFADSPLLKLGLLLRAKPLLDPCTS